MTGTENIIRKTAASTHHNRQRWQIIMVQPGRAPTDQRSSRSGIQRVKDPGDRCIEIGPEEQLRRWGVARFPFSCTSCLSPVKLRPLVAAATRYSRPLSHLSKDGHTSATQKQDNMVPLWELIPRRGMNGADQTARGEKSSCPDVVPADVKLSLYNLGQRYNSLKVQRAKSVQTERHEREMTEHYNTSCHTHNGNKPFFQIKSPN